MRSALLRHRLALPALAVAMVCGVGPAPAVADVVDECRLTGVVTPDSRARLVLAGTYAEGDRMLIQLGCEVTGATGELRCDSVPSPVLAACAMVGTAEMGSALTVCMYVTKVGLAPPVVIITPSTCYHVVLGTG